MSLKASELRIGNLAHHETFGVVYIFNIYQGAYDLSRDGKSKEWFAGHGCTGIPLTEEWLIKFGFKRRNNAWEYKKTDFSIWNLRGSHEFSLNADPINPNIKHVHQLQNLYFALTGEELKYEG